MDPITEANTMRAALADIGWVVSPVRVTETGAEFTVERCPDIFNSRGKFVRRSHPHIRSFSLGGPMVVTRL